MYVVAANGCGNDGNTEYAGYSTVINPNGEIVQELGSDEGVLTTNVDLELVDQQRESIPVLRNLKPNLYNKIAVSLGGTHGFDNLLLGNVLQLFFNLFLGCY